ncbi:MAG: kelch motif-containing protein [Spirochaetia bacterium]|nr:kelch motif-containing protein [Spirochaetia bacterium]
MRMNHVSFVFDNKMRVIGGSDGSQVLKDARYSIDEHGRSQPQMLVHSPLARSRLLAGYKWVYTGRVEL